MKVSAEVQIGREFQLEQLMRLYSHPLTASLEYSQQILKRVLFYFIFLKFRKLNYFLLSYPNTQYNRFF